MKVIPETCSA